MIKAALVQRHALADPGKAAEVLAYHMAPRDYLVIRGPAIEPLAAKPLTQARIRPDQALGR